MRSKHLATLKKLYARPAAANLHWREVEALLIALGATVSEREGFRVGVRLFGERRVFHRPHPTPEIDKGAANSIRIWLQENGVKP